MNTYRCAHAYAYMHTYVCNYIVFMVYFIFTCCCIHIGAFMFTHPAEILACWYSFPCKNISALEITLCTHNGAFVYTWPCRNADAFEFIHTYTHIDAFMFMPLHTLGALLVTCMLADDNNLRKAACF